MSLGWPHYSQTVAAGSCSTLWNVKSRLNRERQACSMQRKSKLHDKHSDHVFIQITAVDDLNIVLIGQEPTYTCKEIVIPEKYPPRKTSLKSIHKKYPYLSLTLSFPLSSCRSHALPGRPWRALALCPEHGAPAEPPLWVQQTLFSFNQLRNRGHHRFQPSSLLLSCQGLLHSQGTVRARLPVRAFPTLPSTDYSYGHLFNLPQGTSAFDQTMCCCRLRALLWTQHLPLQRKG